jgi:hypothetical protein
MVHITYDRLSDQVDEAVDNVPQQSAMPRPQTYYGDGPFDAPSSDSDEDDLLLEKPPTPGLAERGLPLALRVGGAKRRPASLRCLVLCLVGLVALAAGIGALAAANYTGGQAYRPRGTKRIGMDHVMNGTFNYQRRGLNWVPEGEMNSCRTDTRTACSHDHLISSWRWCLFHFVWIIHSTRRYCHQHYYKPCLSH